MLACLHKEKIARFCGWASRTGFVCFVIKSLAKGSRRMQDMRSKHAIVGWEVVGWVLLEYTFAAFVGWI